MAGRGPIGKPVSVGIGILLAIVTLGFYALYWFYKTFQELKDYSGEGVGGGIGLLLYIFGGLAAPVLMGSEVGHIYRSEGQECPITPATGVWFLLPIIGGIIWYVRTQTAINDLWVAHGAEPA